MIHDNRHFGHDPVFDRLKQFSEFYNMLSSLTMNWVKHGVSSIINFDTYVFSSMQGTLDSIQDILYKRRISDAYALLRRYYDSTVINIYTNLFLEENFNLDNYFVPEIDGWLKGKIKIPEYRIMSDYIKKSYRLSQITAILYKDDRYKHIRDRCNAHTHYNYYHHVMINDNEIYIEREKSLNNFCEDLDQIFILHLSQLFYLNDNYMMSTDYADYMDMGMMPPENSQYLVAPFIKDIFEQVIKVKRSDVAEVIKEHSAMQLD